MCDLFQKVLKFLLSLIFMIYWRLFFLTLNSLIVTILIIFVHFIIQDSVKVRYRSSHPEVFCKKGVLRNFEKFTGKHLCQRLFFDKAGGLKLSKICYQRKMKSTFLVDGFKAELSPSKNICFICFDESLLKVDVRCFLFHLLYHFYFILVLKIFTLLS